MYAGIIHNFNIYQQNDRQTINMIYHLVTPITNFTFAFYFASKGLS